jgi:hypothetical protein
MTGPEATSSATSFYHLKRLRLGPPSFVVPAARR